MTSYFPGLATENHLELNVNNVHGYSDKERRLSVSAFSLLL